MPNIIHPFILRILIQNHYSFRKLFIGLASAALID
ncbi:YSIRK-type signal peptide-containing protein [Rhodocytophaga rosea]|uniref:YSIRK-type signal peptide-containing protein n=1 Tax=Rhodocytophaga rosea TaxID=2704465 RepID=A0A6C0GXK4_9BACT|nr:YSIRK-type signal peptide-containing protein [Rhodocytophaga rosea]